MVIVAVGYLPACVVLGLGGVRYGSDSGVTGFVYTAEVARLAEHPCTGRVVLPPFLFYNMKRGLNA